MKNQTMISTRPKEVESKMDSLISDMQYYKHIAFYYHLKVKRLEEYLAIEVPEAKLARLNAFVDNATKHEFYNLANEGMWNFDAPRLPQGFNRGDVINEEQGLYA